MIRNETVIRHIIEEELDIVEELYTDESKSGQHHQAHDLPHVQYIQKGLQQSIQALNW